MKIPIFSFLSLFLFPVLGKGVEIRLDQENYSARHLQTRTQIHHICYAHAASDMIDALRFHYLSDPRKDIYTSPFALSVANSLESSSIKNARRNISPIFFEFGQICASVKTAMKQGIKDFSQVDDPILRMAIPETSEGAILFSHWKNFEELKVEEQKRTREISIEFFKSLQTSFQKDYSKKLNYSNYVSFWLNILSPNHYKISSLATQTRPLPKCQKQELKKKFHDKTLWTYDFIVSYFVNRKKESQFPIGLDFCERYVNTGIQGRLGEKTSPPSEVDCDRHAVTIIGYREKKKQAQVLLKNSRPCHFMSPKFECADSKVWVPLKELLNSSMSIHYFSWKNL